MGVFKISALIVVLAAAAAPVVTGCGDASTKGNDRGALGTLTLSLSGTGATGVQYRLSNASFSVTGPQAATLSSDANPAASSIRSELPAGNYLIELSSGWSLQKETAGVFAPVNAVLLSANPEGFEIFDQGLTPVVFRFRAGDDVVQLGNGTLDVSIGVVDGTCPAGTAACNGSCVDLTSDANNCGACGNVCQAGSACVSGSCQSGLFTFSGVVNDLPISSLTGWSQCYVDTYANFSTPVSDILAACNQGQLLMACRATGSDLLLVAANAPRSDVLFNCGSQPDCSNVSNGAGWYFSDSWSWGFAAAGDSVNRTSCDTDPSNPSSRMCWHTNTGNIAGGWRCGAQTSLNDSSDFERVIFQAP